MIAKGTPHQDGAILARYLVTGKDRERAELWQLRGFALRNIVEAFRSVHVMADGTRCRAPFFHVYVRNREAESLNREQWKHAADCIERILGLNDQPRAIAFHTAEDTGDCHMHIAWSRIDQDTLTAKPLPFFKQRLKRVSRELEKLFGLPPVPDKRESPIRFAPTRAEEEQARRLGLDAHATREAIRGCFERSDCGRSFEAALAAQGLVLARGDSRDFLVVDREGGMHALGKRILGVSAAEIRHRLADLSRGCLPTLEQARALIIAKDRIAPGSGGDHISRDFERTQPPASEVESAPPGPNVGNSAAVGKKRASHGFSSEMPTLSAACDLLDSIEANTSTATTPDAHDEISSTSVPKQANQDPTPSATFDAPGVHFCADDPEVCSTEQFTDTLAHGDEPPQPPTRSSLADKLGRQFKALVKHLTGRAPVPMRKARRRREETGRSFTSAAKTLFRRVIDSTCWQLNPFWDPFVWPGLWLWEEMMAQQSFEHPCEIEPPTSFPHP